MTNNLKDIENINKKNSVTDFDWRLNWHYLMLNYGYISKKEFLEIDAEDIVFLIESLREMKK